MFQFNKIVLIVLMLSDVCFSCGKSDEEEEDTNQYLNDNPYENSNEYNPNENYPEYPYAFMNVAPSNEQVKFDVGPSNDQVKLDVAPPNDQVKLDVQEYCFEEIHKVFRFNPSEIFNKKEYYKYALRYLREPTQKDKDAHYSKYPPGSVIYNLCMLYDSTKSSLVENWYAYSYYLEISDTIDDSNIWSQKGFCDKMFPNFKEICRLTIVNFGFHGVKSEVVKAAYLNIVETDFFNENNSPPSNPYTDTLYFPLAYFLHIHDFLKTNDKNMMWPKEYCDQLQI